MVEGKTRITTIRLDAEADRKSRLMAEYFGKPLSEIYRDGIDVLFDQFIENELVMDAINLESHLFVLGYKLDDGEDQLITLIRNKQFNEAAIMISSALAKLPQSQEYQIVINKGTRLVHLLTIN